MIKITNCFKMEPELDKVSADEWREGASSGSMDLTYLKSRFSLQDESALELTLRFRDEAADHDLDCRLTAVSAGDSTVVNTLQTLAALGFTGTDRIVWNKEFSPMETADMLCSYLRGKDMQDVIVCGEQSGIGSSRAVPLYISERLGIPCRTNVTEFSPLDESHLRVVRQLDGYTITEDVEMPVVLAVGDVQKTYLRVPTLMQRMAVASQPIGQIEGVTTEEESLELLGFAFADQSRDSEKIDGSDPAAAAAVIYQRLKQEGVVE